MYDLIPSEISNAFKGCNGKTRLVLSLKDEGAVAYPTKDLVLLRVGFFQKDAEADLDICEKHLLELTSKFKAMVSSKYCIGPYHDPSKTKVLGSDKREVTYEFSKGALKCCGIYVPPGSVICTKCRFNINERVNAADIPKYTPEENSENFNSSASQPMDVDIDSDFSLSQETKSPVFDAMNKFLEASGEKMRIKNRLYKNFNDVDQSWQRKLRKGLTAGICAFTKAITDDPENQYNIYKSVVESKDVEKSLLSSPVMPDDVKEVVRAYNRCNDWIGKRIILSILVMRYSYKDLKVFNKKFEKDIDDETDTEEDFNAAKAKQTENLSFMPHLSKHLYKKAKVHYLINGHALAPVFRMAKKVKKIDPEIVEAIVYFVLSHRVTQQVAHGTRKMTGPYGQRHDVAKVR